jgi:cardiolipin synthase
VEDTRFARAMEEMFLKDLEHSTEIVLSARKKVRPSGQPEEPRRRARNAGQGSAGRVAAGAVRIGNAVGAAITNHRVLGAAEAKIMAGTGLLLLVLTILAVLWPRWVTLPLAALGGWIAIALLVRAYKLHAGQSNSAGENPQEQALEAHNPPRASRITAHAEVAKPSARPAPK